MNAFNSNMNMLFFWRNNYINACIVSGIKRKDSPVCGSVFFFFFFTHEYVTYSVLTSTDVPFSNGNEEKINEIKIELRNEAVFSHFMFFFLKKKLVASWFSLQWIWHPMISPTYTKIYLTQLGWFKKFWFDMGF